MDIKRLRIESGLTQEQLAENSGLSIRAIRDIERGATRRPYRQSLKLVAEGMGLSEGVTAELIGSVYMRPQARSHYSRDRFRGPDRRHGGARPGLAHLPPAPAGFAGRRDVLAWLDARLRHSDGGATAALLAGGPGAGKTAIALRWAHDNAADFSDEVLYVDLRGFDARPALSPEYVLRRLLRALGVPDHQIPLTLEECSAMFRAALAERRSLVVLDNAATVDQVRPLLTGAPHCRVLITSRNAMTGLVVRNGVHRHRVGYLSAGEALGLFESVAGAARSQWRSEVDALLALCGRSPLAIRLMAERVRRQQHIHPTVLAAQLSSRRTPLSAFGAPGDPHSSVRELLSWSYRSLPPAVGEVFMGLARLDVAHFEFDRVAALFPVGGPSADDVADALEWLVEMNLLEEEVPGTYGINRLIWWYAKELAGEVGG
ncbi:helix-turn-helix domain-containing protein [Streptomyces sp. NPDC056387]|uniref:helix-turn-helix domain-containing protein n=1 Tax=Streptomyces sp. NPDC056387 TaxID=3345803 RepID=UPI0035DE4F94